MEKGYWEDGERLEFDGTVAETAETTSGLVVRFEKTFFYPESGGQLADRGTVDGIAILDSQQDGKGPCVVLPRGAHLVVGQHAACVVDSENRRRHSQLHSAQHILSKLLDDRGIRTLSFHMTEEDASIEISTSSLSSAMLREIEDAVERTIWQCLPVETRFVEVSDLGAYDLRKIPELAGGPLRLVSIGDIDTNPCGGTHVSNTGQIGAFAIIRTDKVRGNVRLYFVAGLTETLYRRKSDTVLAEIEGLLTCGLQDLSSAVAKLLQRDHDASRRLKQLQEVIVDQLAVQTAAEVSATGSAAVVLDRVPAEVGRTLVAKLDSVPGPVCVIVYPAGDNEGQFVCSVPGGSEDLLRTFSAVMKEKFGARMGGSGRMIQGKIGVHLTRDQLMSILNP